MELTKDQALSLLSEVAEMVDQRREAWDEARRVRDELVQLLDGQVGMTRAGMARAARLTRPWLYSVLDGQERAEVLEDVLLDPVLRDAIARSVGEYSLGDDDGRIRLDVRA
jgi:hypothetical protein